MDLFKLLQILDEAVINTPTLISMAIQVGIIHYYFITVISYLCYEVSWTDHNIK